MKTLIILGLAATSALALPKNEAPAGPQTADAGAATPAAVTGSITGTVVWDGDMPKPLAPFAIKETEINGCHHNEEGGIDTADRSLLIDKDSKGVSNVVFFLELDGVEPVVPEEAFVFDQDGCRFEPHVVVVPVGASVSYKNSDETNHNIHTYSRKTTPVNRNVAAGDTLPQLLEKAETFEVKCDIHPWMKGYIVVTDASMSQISSGTGTFTFSDVPAGKYKLSWWHEKLGKGKTEEIEVKAGAATPLEVKVKEGKAGGGRRRR
ncbi:MAG: plastocyanin [Planctomycetota bacterium]|jgi:plastocyanin